MKNAFFLIVSVICLSVIFHNIAAATTLKRIQSNKDVTFNLPPPDQIEQKHLIEMDDVYKECSKSRNMSGMRDCQCYAMKFLEKRLETPNVSQGIIHTLLEKQCFDYDKMIVHYFGECTTSTATERALKENKDPIAFCECVSNNVASGVMNMPIANGNRVGNIKDRANKFCLQ